MKEFSIGDKIIVTKEDDFLTIGKTYDVVGRDCYNRPVVKDDDGGEIFVSDGCWEIVNGDSCVFQDKDTGKDLYPSTKTQVGGTHYKDMAIQPIDFILGNDLGFVEGNIVKYICRYKEKGGIKDIEKARHYCDILIEQIREEALTELTRIGQEMEKDDTTDS